MPRIRYRRDYDWTPRFGEDDSELSQEDEPVSGQSWLSNAAIASQLDEARIKTAIKSLKAQITVLEAELLSRRLMGKRETHRNWDKIGNLRPKKYASSGTTVGRRNKKNTQFSSIASLRKTLAKLGVKDVNALLATWGKITAKEK